MTVHDHINPVCWKRVTLKAVTKKFVKKAEVAGLKIANLSVASTGTVYIAVAIGDWDAEYRCYGSGDELDIRISNHKCRAGAWSFDDRTENYTFPHADLSCADDIDEAIKDAVQTLEGYQ